MKAKITVEQFDNGTSMKWQCLDEPVDPEAKVVVSPDEPKTLGEMIMSDIKLMMDKDMCNVVEMNIEYTTKADKV